MPWALPRATAHTGCEASAPGVIQHASPTTMIRWLIVVFLALVLINGLMPWLQRLGLGRLPGDLHFCWRGREWSIPLASTVVLSLLASWIAKWV